MESFILRPTTNVKVKAVKGRQAAHYRNLKNVSCVKKWRVSLLE